ncbi:MAG: aminodeoxychorismate synthase component I [Lachnospiraceae bacterium]|nr:aminodeoxychorismate synthase component I [Lachnospiraceae bacterium]
MKTMIRKLPFYRELAEVFERYRKQELAVFLDSSLENDMGQYSVIGLNPYLVLKEEDGVFYRNGKPEPGSFESELKECFRRYREENPTKLPLTAGAIGYFSYDYGRKFEQIRTRHQKKIRMPEALFAFYDLLIIEDKKARALYVTARGELEPQEQALKRLEEELEPQEQTPDSLKQERSPQRHDHLADFTPNFEKEEYKQTVAQMISYIVEGDIYIANMTQQLRVNSTKDPYEVYRYLRTYNPSPFGGYFNYGDFQIVSASPERFLLVKDGRIETRPIKGTRRRGSTPEEDAALKKELQESSKDRSELLMIVDLERNDLNHVCEPGTVEVTEHFAVETYATVFHLVTTVTGKMKEELQAMDLVEAAFPGGSITGAPKIRAMEIIDELEHDRRGLYTGSIGYLSLDGSCDLNIVIRTAVYQDGVYHLGVGGGITCESELEFEYEETLQKAKAVLEAIAD